MPSDAPMLPVEISNDGRELWDWASRLGAWAARNDRARTIRAAILESTTTCGSCDLWMTSSCPREKAGPHGRPVGPSCKALKCDKFHIKAWDAARLKGLVGELAELEESHE